ncbi:polyprenyl synthetase family protein [Campylobacter hepaticus]|uniref:Polyprenyl synthetase family protein n=1 Tax=Campylobacter hepaticus TaxID=1813019 RepID=A0A424YZK1_9BACT|nr:polyprenyl synthetase family protein [Campylobacter hepaticus]AXP08946.1 polyprenyl synthetase family protein [Campylobacter hepaticus]MCZ0772015.1 polyprenyl synthetase family protein [Campylobacter hepaticus]MCZ0773484.1 polyprenyl synthetase family protein [Campylobacter hepaticus]MCZ0774734.1 polyprenyl synthetase family protein [Campylobacter hepaticus]MDX2331677.1 polyprenyl synthetase family protein [Campylobacter hepaticus]
MQKIDDLIKEFLKDLNYKPILNMLENVKSGKKLRSKLLLSIAPQSDDAYKICAIIELIHLASLLHDDIIDESKLRRGAKSVNAEFGTKNALMLGDILYSKAFYELSQIGLEFASIISDAVVKLAIGELMDVELAKSFNLNKQAYLTMIYNKTAILIEASARCGAILAKHNEEDFAQYGKNLGLAFQMIDDILDIKSNELTLGKPVMSDFKEGKTTLPYIYLYESLDEENKLYLQNLFKKDLNEDEKRWLLMKLQEHQALHKAILEAKTYAKMASKSIEHYGNNKLNDIIQAMIDREF